MPWFKVDDTFAMHEKVMAAGNAAVGLWTRAGAWSMQQLTDGFVPDHVLRALGTPKERRNLVEVSLWVEVEGGVRFKNWEERQPTKEQVETARQAATERQRHARERAKSRRESRRDSHGSSSVSHGPPDPTRPDPLLPTEVEPLSRTRSEPEGADRFEEFWDAYGHKRDRANAEKKWRLALRKPGVDANLLIAAAAEYVTWERANNSGGQFIMGPAKWLLNERWRDERPARQSRPDAFLASAQRLHARDQQIEELA